MLKCSSRSRPLTLLMSGLSTGFRGPRELEPSKIRAETPRFQAETERRKVEHELNTLSAPRAGLEPVLDRLTDERRLDEAVRPLWPKAGTDAPVRRKAQTHVAVELARAVDHAPLAAESELLLSKST